jgi:hypothetical protein
MLLDFSCVTCRSETRFCNKLKLFLRDFGNGGRHLSRKEIFMFQFNSYCSVCEEITTVSARRN